MSMQSMQNNLNEELNRLSVNAADFQPDTSLFQYIRWMNETIENQDENFKTNYLPIIEQEKEQIAETRPFLSVVIRTQGKRREMLREAILSLAGQSDEDFEVLLIGHKLDEDEECSARKILDEQPGSLKRKIRYIPWNQGTRAAPLNVGFSYAHGEYVAFLDDDDIVFDNWVECFHKAALEKPGTIIHTYAIAQKWITVKCGETEQVLRSVGAPEDTFCVGFEMLRQLECNRCPLMSLAFPTVYFQKYGICFDESLTTTEDWDFLMRTASFAGVTNVPEPTAIYRLWQNAENSHTVHTQNEWEKNYDIIQEKFKNMPVLLPKGSLKVFVSYREQSANISLRTALKEKLRQKIPRPIWFIAKKLYRFFGGKKWLG